MLHINLLSHVCLRPALPSSETTDGPFPWNSRRYFHRPAAGYHLSVMLLLGLLEHLMIGKCTQSQAAFFLLS